MRPSTPISSIMTTDLVTVRPDEKAAKIRELFNTHRFHHLPVTTEKNNLVGIISRHDVQHMDYLLSRNTTGKIWTARENERITAEDIMTAYPMHLEKNDTIGLAADLFLSNRFHALPIVEDGQLIGLITTHDLLEYTFGSRSVDERMRDC